MSDEMKTQTNEQPDQFYIVLKGYVQYCIQSPKTKLSDREKEEMTAEEIALKENELRENAKRHEEQKTTFQKTYDTMCEAISKDGIVALGSYVCALKQLYEDNSEWKRDIKTALVSSKSLKLFKEAREHIVDLYPLLEMVNKTFPVEDYWELSLVPKAALYGSEVNKSAKGSTIKSPLGNDDIQAMLSLFLEVKDYKRFGEWLMAILTFTPTQVVESFRNDYIPQREQLRTWTYKQLEIDENYRRALMDMLIKNKKLNELVDAYIAQPSMQAKQKVLEEQIKKLEEVNEQEKADHEIRREKQFAIIQEKEASLAELRKKLGDFERCSQQLTVYMGKYQAQVDMNERITAENERRLQDIETEYNRLLDELADATAQLEKLHTDYDALQSDYSLKNNELLRMKEAASQKEETARIDLMRELVTGINEQLFYLTMFYLELKETGRLEEQSIELYADTLDNIDEVLKKLGISKIGTIDERVTYDSTMHISTDARIANGEPVIVNGYGWKIGNDVFIKAPVEKGE